MDGFIHKVVVFAFFVASGNALKSQNYIDFSHRSRLPRFFHFHTFFMNLRTLEGVGE